MDSAFEPNYQSVVGFFARTIMRDLRLVGGFDVLFGKIKAFIEHELFDQAVELEDAEYAAQSIRARGDADAHRNVQNGVNALTVQDTGTTEIRAPIKLSETRPVPGQGSEVHRAQASASSTRYGRQRLRARVRRLPGRLRRHRVVRQEQPEHALSHRVPQRGRRIANYFPDFLVKQTDVTSGSSKPRAARTPRPAEVGAASAVVRGCDRTRRRAHVHTPIRRAG